mmetsp:Transcript_100425/g.287384  ORF Transcript_100425/g.287384 Transcript_100425/m.287384 type:complete len:280 (-) Transcript_100425:861-1700(-)
MAWFELEVLLALAFFFCADAACCAAATSGSSAAAAALRACFSASALASRSLRCSGVRPAFAAVSPALVPPAFFFAFFSRASSRWLPRAMVSGRLVNELRSSEGKKQREIVRRHQGGLRTKELLLAAAAAAVLRRRCRVCSSPKVAVGSMVRFGSSWSRGRGRDRARARDRAIGEHARAIETVSGSTRSASAPVGTPTSGSHLTRTGARAGQCSERTRRIAAAEGAASHTAWSPERRPRAGEVAFPGFSWGHGAGWPTLARPTHRPRARVRSVSLLAGPG